MHFYPSPLYSQLASCGLKRAQEQLEDCSQMASSVITESRAALAKGTVTAVLQHYRAIMQHAVTAQSQSEVLLQELVPSPDIISSFNTTSLAGSIKSFGRVSRGSVEVACKPLEGGERIEVICKLTDGQGG